MCDLAWVVLSDRVRAAALADRMAFLMAGEAPPNPDALVEEFAALLAAAPDEHVDDMPPQLRAVRDLLTR